jgi:hypothetical protein
MVYLILGIFGILFILFGFGMAIQLYRTQKKALENGQTILPDYQTVTKNFKNKSTFL